MPKIKLVRIIPDGAGQRGIETAKKHLLRDLADKLEPECEWYIERNLHRLECKVEVSIVVGEEVVEIPAMQSIHPHNPLTATELNLRQAKLQADIKILPSGIKSAFLNGELQEDLQKIANQSHWVDELAKKAWPPGIKAALLNGVWPEVSEEEARVKWPGTNDNVFTKLGELIMTKQENFWETGTQFQGEEAVVQSYPKVHVLIDGDIVAYRASAAADGRYYVVHNTNGQEMSDRFRYSKDVKSFCDKKSIPNSQIHSDYDPEPVENALHSTAVTIENIKNYYIHERKLNPVVKIFYSGSENFRYEIFPDYKKSRVGVRRPAHLQACKDYLGEQFGAFQFDGYEADDLIAMTKEAALDPLVEELQVSVVSCDKDFTQLGGTGVEQYDYTTGKVWAFTEQEAIMYFYKQLLMGDKSDDIPGIPRVGSQTAIKLLAGAEEPRDLYNAVVTAYKSKVFNGGDDDYNTEQAVAHVQMVGSLLHLRRKENEIWKPPTPRPNWKE